MRNSKLKKALIIGSAVAMITVTGCANQEIPEESENKVESEMEGKEGSEEAEVSYKNQEPMEREDKKELSMSDDELLALDLEEVNELIENDEVELLDRKWELEIENLDIKGDSYYYFTLDECPGCIENEENYANIREKYGDKVIEVNLSDPENFENSQMADKMEVERVPHFIKTDKDGKIDKEIEGVSTIEEFEEKFIE